MTSLLINKVINNIYKKLETFSDKYLSMKMNWNLYCSFNKLDKMVVIKLINSVTSNSNDPINTKVKNNIKNQIKTYESK